MSILLECRSVVAITILEPCFICLQELGAQVLIVFASLYVASLVLCEFIVGAMYIHPVILRKLSPTVKFHIIILHNLIQLAKGSMEYCTVYTLFW